MKNQSIDQSIIRGFLLALLVDGRFLEDELKWGKKERCNRSRKKKEKNSAKFRITQSAMPFIVLG